MLTPPELEDPRQYDYEYGDQEEMIYKKNALNAYHYDFYNALKVIVGELNVEFQLVADSRLDITNKSGQVAADRQAVTQMKASVDQSKNHIDQQKQAIDTTAGQVSQNAQQVASDKQLVAQDKQAAAASAQAAGESAGQAEQSKQAAQDLYQDLDAVNTAKTQSQQAATTASEQRALAVTARQEAEQALAQALLAAADANADVDAAIAALVDSAPGALDTLNELAAALGDDPNFSTTMLNALAEKANATGSYSSLRARGTTKGDVGLSNIPNGITASRELDSDDHLLTARGMNAHRASDDHDGRYYTKSQSHGQFWRLGSGTGYAPSKNLNDYGWGDGGYLRGSEPNSPPGYSTALNIQTLPGYGGSDSLQLAFPGRTNDRLLMRVGRSEGWRPWIEFFHSGNSNMFNSSGTYSGLRAQATTKSDVGLGNVQNVDQTNASNLTSGTINFARVPSTSSRTSTSTSHALNAAAMNNHRTSSDHDGRYYRKSEFSEEADASTPVVRMSNGDIRARLFRSTYTPTNSNIAVIYTAAKSDGTDFMRPSTPAQVKEGLGLGPISTSSDGMAVDCGSNGSFTIENRNLGHTHYTSSNNSHYFYGTVSTQSGFKGDGSGVTNINASNIASGSINFSRVPSTSSRTSSSTSHALNAAAMNNHRVSGDHDGRYLLQSSWSQARGIWSVPSEYNPATAGVPGYTVGYNSAGNGYASLSTDGDDIPLFLNVNKIGHIARFHRAGAQTGFISTSSSGVNYSSNSDYRLKDVRRKTQGALASVINVPVYDLVYKADETQTEVVQFLAHEVQAEVPEAVTGEKDAVDKEGNPVYQGVDNSKLVPTLWRAVQELSEELNALKAQLKEGK